MSKQLLFLVVCFFCHFLMGQGESDVFTMPSKMSMPKPVSSNGKEEPQKTVETQRNADTKTPTKETPPVSSKDIPAKTTPAKTTATPTPTKDIPAKTTPAKETAPVSTKDIPAKTTPAKTTTTPTPTKDIPAKTTPAKTTTTPTPTKDIPAKTTPTKETAPVSSKDIPAKTTPVKEPVPVSAKDVPAKTTTVKETAPVSSKEVPAKTTPVKEPAPVSAKDVPAKTTPVKEPVPVSAKDVPAKTTPTKETAPVSSKEVPAKTTPAKTTVAPKSKAAVEKPYEMYVSLWEPGWKAGKVNEEPTIAEYFMFKNGQNISNFTEMAGITTYKEFFAKNVEQISGEFVEDMKPKYGKAKYTEVDKNVYGDNSYIIFMIETEDYNNTGKPQSIIQHVIKGTDYVHTCYYINAAKKMPASEKRKWESFFKKASLQKMLPSAYLSMIGVEK